MICQNEDSVCGFLVRKKFADVVVDFTFPLHWNNKKHYLLLIIFFTISKYVCTKYVGYCDWNSFFDKLKICSIILVLHIDKF